VGEVLELPADHPHVLMGMSVIQGFCIWYRSSRAVAERMFPKLKFTPESIDWMANFIADFSLAGMRALVQNWKGN